MAVDYYKILGVSRSAGDDEIKKQYRKLARKYHPDVSKLKNAEQRFKELNEAYDVLKNPERRRNYDAFGDPDRNGWQHSGFNRSAGQSRPDWEKADFGGFGQGSFSDIFDKMFNNQNRQKATGASRSSHSGHTHQPSGPVQTLDIYVSLEDVAAAVEKTFILTIPGEQNKKKIKVKIPKGIEEGKKIRLNKQGKNHSDLLLKINYEPHKHFIVKDRDIYLNLPVSIQEAYKGATIGVPTLAGRVDLKIPAGSQSGKKLRLKGRGLGNPTAGDLYVTLLIKLPAANVSMDKVIDQLEKTSAYNPRDNFY